MSGGGGGGSRVSIPTSVRKMIENIKEITGNHSDDEIYAMLKECSMDPNETTQKLLLQGTFSFFYSFVGFFSVVPYLGSCWFFFFYLNRCDPAFSLFFFVLWFFLSLLLSSSGLCLGFLNLSFGLGWGRL